MNCQDVAEILDDRLLSALSTAERVAVAAHVDGCQTCASDWTLHQAVAAEPVPAITDELIARCRNAAVASVASEEKRNPARGPFIVGLFIFGAAVAMLAHKLVDMVPAGAAPESPDASVTVEQTPLDDEQPTVFAAETIEVSTDKQADSSVPPFTVAILPIRAYENGFEPFNNDVYTAVIAELRAVPNVVLIELGATGAVDRDSYDCLIEPVTWYSTEVRQWEFVLFYSVRGRAVGHWSEVGHWPPSGDAVELGKGLAMRVRRSAFPPDATVVARARGQAVDPNAANHDQVSALLELRSLAARGLDGRDEAVLRAAVDTPLSQRTQRSSMPS